MFDQIKTCLITLWRHRMDYMPHSCHKSPIDNLSIKGKSMSELALANFTNYEVRYGILMLHKRLQLFMQGVLQNTITTTNFIYLAITVFSVSLS